MFIVEATPPISAVFFFLPTPPSFAPPRGGFEKRSPDQPKPHEEKRGRGSGGNSREQGAKRRERARAHGSRRKEAQKEKRAPVKTGTQGKGTKRNTRRGNATGRKPHGKRPPTRAKPQSVVPLDNGTEQPRGEDGAQNTEPSRERRQGQGRERSG